MRQRVLRSSRPRWRPRAAGSTALPMQLGLQAAHYLLGCRYWCTNMLSSLSIQPPLFLQRNGDAVALAVQHRYYRHYMPGAVLEPHPPLTTPILHVRQMRPREVKEPPTGTRLVSGGAGRQAFLTVQSCLLHPGTTASP